MNQIGAFKETVRLAREAPWHTTKEGCSVIHLEDTLAKILSAESTRHPYSSGKLGRHLGWAQAVVCMYSPAGHTLETFKAMNRRYGQA